MQQPNEHLVTAEEVPPFAAVQTPVPPLRPEHDVLPQTGPVRHERTGPERRRHGPAAPVSGIPRYGPQLLGGGLCLRRTERKEKKKERNIEIVGWK